MKNIPEKAPRPAFLRRVLHRLLFSKRFDGSEQYWIQRYKGGGNSGAGSYGHLADFKAEVGNEFVQAHSVKSIIEYGCGDGNQLRLATYPAYRGLDVSSEAVDRSRSIFRNDTSKPSS